MDENFLIKQIGWVKTVFTNFKAFFKTFYTTFTPENDKLLETAIDKLKNDNVWKANPYKKRSLINAFALTYAEMPVFEGSFESFKKGAMFSRFPVEKLSRQTTAMLCATKVSIKLEPIKPAPPVTKNERPLSDRL